jgi:hypothetical protein
MWNGEAGMTRVLAELSDGFTMRPDEADATIMIVLCGNCGTAQPAQLARGHNPSAPV